jgi:hypothetical protein
MDDVSRICSGLRLTCPSLDAEQLLAMVNPSAEFEAHVPAETGKDFWIYTINGKTFDGDLIVVRASLPGQAETLAQEGLADTINGLRHFKANTGLQAEVEMRPAQ